MPRDADFKQHLCADIEGFSLPAALRCGADDRQALANERVQTNAVGQVALKHKTACRDGATHLVMSPLKFMQRLAVLTDPAAAEPANDRFRAFNLGCRIPGLGRSETSTLRGRGFPCWP
jgi:hypothetical protein